MKNCRPFRFWSILIYFLKKRKKIIIFSEAPNFFKISLNLIKEILLQMEDLVISENIEVIVYGHCNEKFIERILLNTGFRASPMINPLIKQNKEFLSLFLSEAGALNPAPSTITAPLGPLQSPQQANPQQSYSQVLSKTKSRRKTYFKNVNKLLNIAQIDEENEGGNKENKTENLQLQQLEKGITFLSWSDFRRVTSTISTRNFWINVNFNLVSDMFLDPYINNFVTANINLLVISFELDNENQMKKALDLYKKLATSKPPSSIKYQSQMLLLQSGYYQAFNDNIVLALCELPEIEVIGPCCLVGFGENDQEMKKLSFDKDIINNCVGFYEWLIQTHQQIKYSNKLDEEHINEITRAVRDDFLKKNNENNNSCRIF